MKVFSFIFSCILSSATLSQKVALDVKKIKESPLENYFVEHGTNLKKFEASLEVNSNDYSNYNYIDKTYTVDYPLKKTFETYITIPPNIGWNTSMSTFKMLYDKKSEKIYYQQDELPKCRVGQYYFLELKLFEWLDFYKIPVAFEVSKIDKENKVLEITYLKQNKSHGRQILKFEKTSEKKTQITHISYFNSGNFLRDAFYEPFHNKIVDAFHANFKKILEKMAEDEGFEPPEA